MRDADVEGARPESGPGGTGQRRIAAAESLLGEFTGLGVINCCDREPKSRCYEILPSAEQSSSARSR